MFQAKQSWTKLLLKSAVLDRLFCQDLHVVAKNAFY